MARAIGEGLEALEYTVDHFRRNAAPTVADLEHDLGAASHRRLASECNGETFDEPTFVSGRPAWMRFASRTTFESQGRPAITTTSREVAFDGTSYFGLRAAGLESIQIIRAPNAAEL